MKGKKTLIKLILFMFFLTFVFGAYMYVDNVIKHPFNSYDGKVKVVVNSGSGLYETLNSLYKEKKIKNLFITKIYIKKNNLNTNIKPGTYEFNSQITLNGLIKDLNDGIFNVNLTKVSIPEGYDIEHIASTFESKGIISKNDFIKACKDYELPEYINKSDKKKYSLEGYLFPDTYEFTKGMKGKDIIDIMVHRFEFMIKEIEKSSNIKIDNENIEKIITIASIVEGEAEVDIERGKVASVFYNRIDKGMKLQSCATVLYAMGKHKDKLYNNDLKIESPFNTYIVNGLPEGPICNPGRKSIEAALKPDKTNYLYFVSNNNGTHFFTEEYNEFLKVKKVTQGN